MLSTVRGLAADAVRSYSRHSGRMLASAVAFSALLSIAPLLFIAIGVASVAIGGDLGRASVRHDLGRWIGADSADTIMGLLDHARATAGAGSRRIGGAIVLVYASTRLFSQMKRALNHMWDIHAKSGAGLQRQGLEAGPQAWARAVARRVRRRADHRRRRRQDRARRVDRALQRHVSGALFHGGEMVVSLATTTLMFAALFKTLPDARLAWRDAWRGALVTSVLFSIGTTLIGLYLGHKTLDVFYGPGGSLVLLLLWVQYSAQVFFLGAAVTGELARRRGHAIEPDDHGVRIVIEEGM